MDIGNGKGPALSQLSTMALHSFVIGEVRCTSIESFIQSLKFEKASLAASICADKPKLAKERGKKLITWASSGNVWWKGQAMPRASQAYTVFLANAIREVSRQCSAFRQALIDTGSMPLTSPGKSRESETPVTEAEYCQALTRVRHELIVNINKKSAQEAAA